MKKIYFVIVKLCFVMQCVAQPMSSFDFTQPFKLETDRVVIRNLSQDDRTNMFEWCCDERVTKWLTWDAHKNKYQTRDLITKILNRHTLGKPEWWAFVDKKTNYVFGIGGFHEWETRHKKAEIGIILSPKYWNKGFATEIIRSLVAFAFAQTDIHRIEAIIACDNTASWKVFEKIGFVNEGKLKGYKLLKGRFVDHYSYAMTNF